MTGGARRRLRPTRHPAGALAVVLAGLAGPAAAGSFADDWRRNVERCVVALVSGEPFVARGLLALQAPVVAPEHAEWPARSWADPQRRMVTTMIEFPGDGGVRRSCDLRATAWHGAQTVLDVHGAFLDWGTRAAASGGWAFESTRRNRDSLTGFAALTTRAPNGRGCMVAVSQTAMPAEGLTAFSASERAGPGCGGPAIIGEGA